MSRHTTVLETEAVDALAIAHGNVVIDATANGGGHSEVILERLGDTGTLIAIDIDPDACKRLREKFGERNNVAIINSNFKDIGKIVAEIQKTPDAILADLGWSSEQFEAGGRGFSFRVDEPLLMTYGNPETYLFTAYDVVNGWKEADIADVLYAYADERQSRKIARAIVEYRRKKIIHTSGQFATLIESVIPRRGKIHPATKTFQALRIVVNDELGVLKEFIHTSIDLLNPGGRLAIITFHSIEDRLVKTLFKEKTATGQGTRGTKKPLTPTRAEIIENPRARSAKLRIFIKTFESI